MDDKQFLKELKEYIETTEIKKDGEWGACRELDKLINDNEMPELYFEVLKRLGIIKCKTCDGNGEFRFMHRTGSVEFIECKKCGGEGFTKKSVNNA